MLNRHQSKARSGFTILELLVTIAIILVLTGLLFPAVMHVVKKSRSQRVSVQLQALVAAAKNYKNEYGRWPGQAEADAADRLKDHITDHYDFVNALTNNVRNFQFIELEPTWLSGSGTELKIVDPWGHEIYIGLDRNGDGDVAVIPVIETGYLSYSNLVPNNTAAALSWGPDPSKETSLIRSWRL